jgi:hypothetical protein
MLLTLDYAFSTIDFFAHLVTLASKYLDRFTQSPWKLTAHIT